MRSCLSGVTSFILFITVDAQYPNTNTVIIQHFSDKLLILLFKTVDR